jgi:hypothetical protein
VELSAASMSEEGKSRLRPAHKGKRGGGSSAGNAGSCAGAVETGVSRAVSDVVWEQGSGRCTWLHASTWAGRG